MSQKVYLLHNSIYYMWLAIKLLLRIGPSTCLAQWQKGSVNHISLPSLNTDVRGKL